MSWDVGGKCKGKSLPHKREFLKGMQSIHLLGSSPCCNVRNGAADQMTEMFAADQGRSRAEEESPPQAGPESFVGFDSYKPRLPSPLATAVPATAGRERAQRSGMSSLTQKRRALEGQVPTNYVPGDHESPRPNVHARCFSSFFRVLRPPPLFSPALCF